MKTSELKEYLEFVKKMDGRVTSDEARAARYAEEIIRLRDALQEINRDATSMDDGWAGAIAEEALDNEHDEYPTTN